MLREILATMIDILRCGDLWGHLRALAEVLGGEITADTPVRPMTTEAIQ